MIFFPTKRSLGIDIGTSAIKIVELSRFGKRKKLENYGEIKAEIFFKKPFRTFEKDTLTFSERDVARGILAILEEANIKLKKAIFSIPDFSTFFTTFDLPPMSKEELPQAIRFEARKHIPLPISEVTLDWQIIEGKPSQKTPLRILLVAVPNRIISQYQEIARLSNLEILALEPEVFGLIKSLIEERTEISILEEKRIIALVDIGARTTTCSIIDQGILKISHSFDTSGDDLTRVVADSLSINLEEAENLKKKYGLLPSPQEINKILSPLIDLILMEIEKISQSFYHQKGRRVEKIIIAGGAALLPGILKYFSDFLKIEVEIANPFSYLFYPPILEKTLKEMGPAYAIAVGMALGGLE